MEKARSILNKERIKLDQRSKELTSNIFFYEELEYYLKPKDREKKVNYYTARKKEVMEALEEIDFLLELMDKAGIDEIYKNHQINQELKDFKTCQGEIEKYEVKGEVL